MTIVNNAPNHNTPAVSRRLFLKRAGAAGIAASAASAVALSAPASALAAAGTASSGPVMPGYRIDHDPSVRVHVGTGERFTVTVTDLDGNVLETQRRLTGASIQRTESSYFTATGITPPSYSSVAP